MVDDVKPDFAQVEKVGLLGITLACIGALTWISVKALGSDTLDPNASTLLGAIVAGMIATAGACIQALRGFAMSAQLGKVTDQLAAAAPVPPPASDGASAAANEVADAAVNRAEDFKP